MVIKKNSSSKTNYKGTTNCKKKKTCDQKSSTCVNTQKKSKYSVNVYNKSLFKFNEYIYFQNNEFVKNKRTSFLDRIQKEFNVQDKQETYARCHSVSYHSMVTAVVKTFNFLYGVKMKKIKDFNYDKAVNIAIEYLAGLALAVKKFPLIVSDDYTLLSKNNAYNEIIKSQDVKVSFVKYILSKSLILKLIYKSMFEEKKEDFIQDLVCYGNIFLEKLNNTSINLRVGAQKYNVVVGADYDIISYKSAKDGIIIDTEMDCCSLSHVKNIMYNIEDNISYFSPRAITMPPVFEGKTGYEVVTSYQNNKDFAKQHNIAKVNIYINDWYTKNKSLVLMN